MLYQTLIDPIDKFIAYNYATLVVILYLIGSLAIVYAYIAKQIQEYQKAKKICEQEAIRKYLMNESAD